MTAYIDVDSFAGGGGASLGIEAALGKPVDIAINHDLEAIAIHAATTREHATSTAMSAKSIRPSDPHEVWKLTEVLTLRSYSIF